MFNQTMAFLITRGVLFGICLAFIYFKDGSGLNFSKSSVHSRKIILNFGV